MEFSGSKILPVQRELLWESLHDAQLLAECISGCESLDWRDDSSLEGQIIAKVGPVKAQFDIEMTISDAVPMDSYTISGEAKSKAQGFANGEVDIRIDDVEDGCELFYDARLRMGGKIAQVGSRLLVGTARKFVNGFFDSLTEAIAGEPKADSEAGGHEPSSGD